MSGLPPPLLRLAAAVGRVRLQICLPNVDEDANVSGPLNGLTQLADDAILAENPTYRLVDATDGSFSFIRLVEP
jgi:hypothetical protein